MSLQSDLLMKYGKRIEQDFKNAVPKVTGKTANSIVAITDDVSIEIWANRYIYALEFGRKPSAPDSHVSGTPYLVDAIKEWALAKGIIGNEDSESMGIVWAITNSIHKHGTLLFQEHTPSGILSGVVDDLDLDELLEKIGIIKMGEIDNGITTEMERLVSDDAQRFK